MPRRTAGPVARSRRCRTGGGRRRPFAQQRHTFVGPHGEKRALAAVADGHVDQLAHAIFRQIRYGQDRIDVEIVQEPRRDVRCARQRIEEAFFVRRIAPRTALAEDGGVEIPRAQLPLVPHEIVAHAHAPANRALCQRHRRMFHAVENVFRHVFRIDEKRFGEAFGDFGMPTHT